MGIVKEILGAQTVAHAIIYLHLFWVAVRELVFTCNYIKNRGNHPIYCKPILR